MHYRLVTREGFRELAQPCVHGGAPGGAEEQESLSASDGELASPDVNGAHLRGKLTSWRHEEIGIRPRHSP